MKHVKRKQRFYQSQLDECADYLYKLFYIEKRSLIDITKTLATEKEIVVHRTTISRWLEKNHYKKYEGWHGKVR